MYLVKIKKMTEVHNKKIDLRVWLLVMLNKGLLIEMYIGFDCETTGTDPSTCQLLTVSFCVLSAEMERVDSLNLSLRSDTGYHVFPDAMRVNKIDIVNHHESALSLDNARRILLEFLNKHKGAFTMIPVGHNIQFDIGFLKGSGLMTGEEIRKYFSFGMIDTMVVSQFMKLCGKIPKRQRISLTSLSEYYNLDRRQDLEHSAEYDVSMTVDVLKKMVRECSAIAGTTVSEPSCKKRKLY